MCIDSVLLCCARTTGVPGWAIERQFGSLISSAERDRANRFRRLDDRYDFIVAHGLIRVAAGAVLQREPDSVEIHQDGSGAPFVKGLSASVSLSHTKDLVACCAAGESHELGVDAESLASHERLREILEIYTSVREQTMLGSTCDTEQAQQLVDLWVAKEAVLKARGVGLSGPEGTAALRTIDCRLISETI